MKKYSSSSFYITLSGDSFEVESFMNRMLWLGQEIKQISARMRNRGHCFILCFFFGQIHSDLQICSLAYSVIAQSTNIKSGWFSLGFIVSLVIKGFGICASNPLMPKSWCCFHPIWPFYNDFLSSQKQGQQWKKYSTKPGIQPNGFIHQSVVHWGSNVLRRAFICRERIAAKTGIV